MTPTRGRAGIGDTSHGRNWPALLVEARRLVESPGTGVTLRQMFDRLVAAELLPGTTNAYKALLRYTA